MGTRHRAYYSDSRHLGDLAAESVHLVVTSPPYPMIEMWDETFARQNPRIGAALAAGEGERAFQLMHSLLAETWKECYRVLKEGGLLCVNIGDATRTLGDSFQLYPSHAQILQDCQQLGFRNLPNIIWRKPTNAPTKFMGSGMYPPGAYVTLEHEYILILRKGNKRTFGSPAERQRRRESGFFWEERNRWFSDVWMDLKGVEQHLGADQPRLRSAAFPFELAYRLINMFSIKGDTVLDPFGGTGTTMAAAMTAERHSVLYEVDRRFKPLIDAWENRLLPFANDYIHRRLQRHVDFIRQRQAQGKSAAYRNAVYHFPCVSRQESRIFIKNLKTVLREEVNVLAVEFDNLPQKAFCKLF